MSILWIIAGFFILLGVLAVAEASTSNTKQKPQLRKDSTGRLLSSGVSWTLEDKLKALLIVKKQLHGNNNTLLLTLKQLGDRHIRDFPGRTRDSLASAFSRYRKILTNPHVELLKDEDLLLQRAGSKRHSVKPSKLVVKQKYKRVPDSPTRFERVKDKEILNLHLTGEFIVGSKTVNHITYHYKVKILRDGFRTQGGDTFLNPQAAVNQDILDAGIPKNRKNGLSFWSQARINGLSLEEAISSKRIKKSIFHQSPIKDDSMDNLIRGLNKDAKKVLKYAVEHGGTGHISGKLAKKILKPDKVLDLIKSKNLIIGPQPGQSRANLSFQLRPEVQRYLNVNSNLLK